MCIVYHLFPNHYDSKLLSKLNQTSTIAALKSKKENLNTWKKTHLATKYFGYQFQYITYILISKGAKDVVVSTWIANKATFEERDVENGRIEVDKLEDEYLECQIIVEFWLSSMHF